jgi:hypothetical protein
MIAFQDLMITLEQIWPAGGFYGKRITKSGVIAPTLSP